MFNFLGGSRFVCDVCFKEYSSQTNLNVHFRNAHTTQDLEALTCTLCFKTFRNHNSRRVHMHKYHSLKWKLLLHWINLDHKPVLIVGSDCQCPYCGKTFSRKDAVKLHVRDIHENDGQLQACDLCDYSSKSLSTLRSHKSRAHRDIIRASKGLSNF